ncbi:MAG: hypothetical protein ABR616_18790 [Dermatophilaceae bacterium]|nr:hypothetical protein [Intrasporangiaceae bacterium]
MSDAICRKCQEPWELFYLAHEALWDHPGRHAPKDIIEAHEAILAADDAAWAANSGDPGVSAKIDHYKMGGERLQKAVLSGEGCPSCWSNPERATADEDASVEALRHNLFDSGWDGDPAELF